MDIVQFEALVNLLTKDNENTLKRQVIVFGTGSTALKVCKRISNPHFFVDNDEKKWGSKFLSKPVYSPNVLLDMDKTNLIIIIASVFFDDIAEQLTGMGFVKDKHFVGGSQICEVIDMLGEKGEIKHNEGYCPVCQNNTLFFENGTWLRDCYLCFQCRSIPRQRALMHVLSQIRNKYTEQIIHESSPSGPTFYTMRKKCGNYSYSYYFNDVELGAYKDGAICENLENMTFEDSSFDIFITQDVFEHILNPSNAFKEIARVLKKGGIHIFTVPYNAREATVIRSKQINGNIEYLLPPVYHGDPINSEGCLVTTDWGNDICDYIYKYSGLTTTIYNIKNRELGIDGEYREVFVSTKI